MQWTLSLTLSVCVFDFVSMSVNIYVVYCILSASATEVILHTILFYHSILHIIPGSVSFVWQYICWDVNVHLSLNFNGNYTIG